MRGPGPQARAVQVVHMKLSAPMGTGEKKEGVSERGSKPGGGVGWGGGWGRGRALAVGRGMEGGKVWSERGREGGRGRNGEKAGWGEGE